MEQLPQQDGDAQSLLARHMSAARRALWLEQIAPFALIAAFLFLLWVALALSGVLLHLPIFAITVAAALLALGATLSVLAFLVALLRVKRAAIAARVETDAGLPRGTIASLNDTSPMGSAEAMALVIAARAPVYEQLAQAPLTRPILAPRFTILGAVAGVLFVVLAGVGMALGPSANLRLNAAFAPPWGMLVGDHDLRIEAALLPPDYAQDLTRALQPSENATTLEGASIDVRVSGAVQAPELVMKSPGSVHALRLEPIGPRQWHARVRLSKSTRIAVHRFGERIYWKIKVADDLPPRVMLVATPSLDAQGVLTLQYEASDDLGLVGLAVVVRALKPPDGMKADPFERTRLEFAAVGVPKAQGQATLPLLPHPMAGLEIEARIAAYDALGQEGLSAPFALHAPEAEFANPLARTTYVARKLIIQDKRPFQPARGLRQGIERAPSGVRRANVLLGDLMSRPPMPFPDYGTYLGVSYARARLLETESTLDTRSVTDTLWQVAWRLERGDLARARANFDKANEAMARALREGMPPSSLAPLAETLGKAASDVVSARAPSAAPGNGTGESPNADTGPSPAQIDALVDAVKDLGELGAHESALAGLDVLDRLVKGGGTKPSTASDELTGKMAAALDNEARALSRLAQDQREAMDENYQMSLKTSDPGRLAKLRARQAELAARLAALGKANGLAAEPDHKRASDAMARALRDLQTPDLGATRLSQNAATGALQSLARSSAARAGALRKGLRATTGQPSESGEGNSGGGLGEVRLPVDRDYQMSRDVLMEIRKRAAQPDLPPAERAYLNRLLERF